MQITITIEADTLDDALAKLRECPFDHTPNAETIAAIAEFDIDPAPAAPTEEEAVAAVRLVLAHKGTQIAQSLLKPYGVTRVADVPAAQRAELIAAAEKAMQ